MEYQEHARRRRACWCKGGYGGKCDDWSPGLLTDVESSASPGLATAGIVGCKNMALAMKRKVTISS